MNLQRVYAMILPSVHDAGDNLEVRVESDRIRIYRTDDPERAIVINSDDIETGYWRRNLFERLENLARYVRPHPKQATMTWDN